MFDSILEILSFAVGAWCFISTIVWTFGLNSKGSRLFFRQDVALPLGVAFLALGMGFQSRRLAGGERTTLSLVMTVTFLLATLYAVYTSSKK